MKRIDTRKLVLAMFSERRGQRLTFRQIEKRLPGEAEDLTGALEDLVEDGVLKLLRKGRYAVAEELGIFRGVLRVRPGGTGFVITSQRERISLEKKDIGRALSGDTVLVRRLEATDVGDVFAGRVEGVLVRRRKGVSGLTRVSGAGWMLCPVDPSLPDRIPLKTGGRDIEAGRIVYADLEYDKRGFSAILRRTLGDPTSPGVLIEALVADSGVRTSFPNHVIEEAERATVTPIDNPAGREDFRNRLTVTIDPVDARDFDDAVSLEITPEGNYLLGVHIADVAAYVPPGSLLDTEASLRGTSVYLPDRVLPMLPEVLSNGSCSLRPGEDRLTVSVMIGFDGEGRRQDFTIYRSMIRSGHRLTYEEALGILEGRIPCETSLSDLMDRFDTLSGLLENDRKRRGALDLGSSELKTGFDGEGWPSGFERVPDDRAHRLIENFMIEANKAVADHCSWIPLQVLYRIHDKPAPDSVDNLQRRLAELELDLPGKRLEHAGELTQLLDSLKDSPAFPIVRDMVLRSLQKAVYSPDNNGHFGLALKSYLHFTSPIRRYPDLLVHQALAAYGEGSVPKREKGMGELALETSSAERRAEALERAATGVMGLLYLSRRIGSIFEGVVSGVKDFGLFVRLRDVPAEGLMPVRLMREMGYHSHATCREGMEIRVRVESANPLERTLTLSPVDSGKGSSRE